MNITTKTESRKGVILIIDDNATNLRVIAKHLNAHNFETVVARNGKAGLERARFSKPDLILLDIVMPDMNGFEVCEKLKASPKTREIPVIFLSVKTEISNIVRGFELGAADYVTKPFQREELLARAKAHVRLRRTEKALRKSLESLRRTHKAVRVAAGIDDIVAVSPSMKNVLKKAVIYHKSPDTPVVIEGETGTGKELAARTIHYGRGEVNTPFVALNISAVVPDLFESELFGYAPGTFTGGSLGGKTGKLAMAGNGTLFLDEIGELSLDLQPKLLRVLQERYYYRVGGARKHPFNGRILCATNRNLDALTKRKSFRTDLYYRINVGYLHIPPLRERPEDIVPLAKLFLGRAAGRRGNTSKKFSSAALKWLKGYPWPGNIRELENLIERICIMTEGDEITPDDIENQRITHRNEVPDERSVPAALLSDTTAPELPEDGLNLEKLTTLIIRKTMEKFGNKTRAAEYLGISRQALHRRLEKMDGM